MSDTTQTLKRHNHRAHPCKNDKKEELLALLLNQNDGKKIIVVTAEESKLTTEQTNVSIVSDRELYKNPDMRCALLISYDVPDKAIVYISRITKSDSHALILLDPSEEKLLHAIETLNGRTIMQERIEGFSEEIIEKVAQPTRKDFDPREERKREFISRDDKPKRNYDDKKPYGKKDYGDKKSFGDKKPYEKKSFSDDKKPWDKKEKQDNKFIGKDENGKAIFSGKSGDRNHSYDGTPRPRAPKLTGKKISIKTLNKKD
ncbi:MAG: hypothetical protein Q9M32_05185 [Sulfurimonas sp.]|nr:hypothetical protein [Sulfurimonas sp.]